MGILLFGDFVFRGLFFGDYVSGDFESGILFGHHFEKGIYKKTFTRYRRFLFSKFILFSVVGLE